MKCAVAGCSEPAEAIYNGLSLCSDCLNIAYELPDEERSSMEMERLIMRTIDAFEEAKRAGEELYLTEAVQRGMTARALEVSVP